MRLKILLSLAAAALTTIMTAQPLHWMEDSPAEWTPMTIKGEFDYYTEGSRAVKITFTETGTPYFVSDTFDVTGNTAFDYSIDVLDNDPGVEVNQRIRFIDNTGAGTNSTSSVYSTDNEAYQTYSYTGTTPASAVKAYVIIRIYDVAASWTGSGTFWIDNASFTLGGGSNLLANPGFEEWPAPVIAPNSTLDFWWEDSPSEFAPITLVPELDNKTHGLVAAKITFTETGTPYFVSDTFEVTANSAFDFSIDVLDNDPGAEVNQRIRFIDNTGAGTNSTSGVYSENNASYQTYSYTGTTPATAVKAYVIIRIYDVAANWSGSGTFYLDNARYTENGGTANLIANGSFEDWLPPSGMPEFLTYKFEGLTPAVTGIVDKTAHTVSLTVPYATDLSTLVATFTLNEGATAKVGTTDQVSGVTANDFSSPVTYTLSSEDGSMTQDWVVTATKAAPSTGKDILSFRFESLNPPVNGIVNTSAHTVALEVPFGTNITSLAPTLVLSDNATVSPASGTAQDFSSPVTYTVTAQDGATQQWVVTVSIASAGKVTLFSEDFESINLIPEGWIIINNDGYTQAPGEERWQDSAWTISTSSRPELAGTKVAMASSYCSNMPLDGKADDWMILPKITIGNNTTLSWHAMSTTSSGNYPDDYMVLIAPAIDGITPTISYFESEANILITVAPESWSAFVGRTGTGLSSRSINLKNAVTPDAPDGWFDRDVWIAFVLITDRYTNPETGVPNSTAGGSNLAIDNILLVNDSGTGIEPGSGSAGSINVYPNPSFGMVKISFKANRSAMAELSVVDLTGRTVMQESRFATGGQNTMDLDLSHLRKGVYFVKTSCEGVDSVSRIILK